MGMSATQTVISLISGTMIALFVVAAFFLINALKKIEKIDPQKIIDVGVDVKLLLGKMAGIEQSLKDQERRLERIESDYDNLCDDIDKIAIDLHRNTTTIDILKDKGSL